MNDDDDDDDGTTMYFAFSMRDEGGKSNESVGYQTIRQQSVRPDELGGVDES